MLTNEAREVTRYVFDGKPPELKKEELAKRYKKMEICITPLPEVSNIEEIAGGELQKWPERLTVVSPRIEGVTGEMFKDDTELWKKRLAYYKNVINQLGQKGRYQNILDMNARLGGFATALIDELVWVMNVVPTQSDINMLGVIYEQGLIETCHDWCEAMSTYPRSCDMIHADSIFSIYKDKCEMEDILLEMDRIPRPEGTMIFQDDVDILIKLKSIIHCPKALCGFQAWNGSPSSLLPRKIPVWKALSPQEFLSVFVDLLHRPVFTHLAGKISVWKVLSPQVLEASFNVTLDLEKLFRSKRTN